MKTKNNLERNFAKNGYLFELKFCKGKYFGNDLIMLDNKWPSPYRKKPLGLAHRIEDLSIIHKNDAQALKQRIKFINNDDDKISALTDDINSFIRKHGLGDEWFLTIADYLISRWLHVPEPNLCIKEDDKRVILVLNPDTSLDDIKDIWLIIKKKQEKLWPDYKKTNFSKKMFRNLDIAISDIIERSVKQFDNSEYGECKTNDLAVVANIWNNEDNISSEADKKRRAILRQNRKRFLDKIA
jgi:hypothetical protein